MFSDTETFKAPTFCLHRSEAGGEGDYEGWVNSATHTFNLYFMQEPKCIEAIRQLIRKDGTINHERALRLFRWTGLPIDRDCEGLVFVPEIVENYLEYL